jgi:hypothetical protein
MQGEKMIATPSTAAIPSSVPQFSFPVAQRGEVGIRAELRHLSRVIYAVPSERVSRLLPDAFEAEGEQTRLSVTSFLDLGAGQEPFEESSYRLHVRRAGRPVCWLLGVSIGSLAGIALRRMWHSPWHLGAMEFQVRHDAASGRYQTYLFRTQSEWANASWTLADTGDLLEDDPGEYADYFPRRDGSLGLRRIRLQRSCMTQATLIEARCDLLESLGLLTREELQRPAVAGLQHATTCTIDAPHCDARNASVYAFGSPAGH